MHKYLFNDRWGRKKNEITASELNESGYYLENQVIDGRIVKMGKNTYSFLLNELSKIDLEEDLSVFLLDMDNCEDEKHDAYSRKKQEIQ